VQNNALPVTRLIDKPGREDHAVTLALGVLELPLTSNAIAFLAPPSSSKMERAPGSTRTTSIKLPALAEHRVYAPILAALQDVRGIMSWEMKVEIKFLRGTDSAVFASKQLDQVNLSRRIEFDGSNI